MYRRILDLKNDASIYAKMARSQVDVLLVDCTICKNENLLLLVVIVFAVSEMEPKINGHLLKMSLCDMTNC